jgi:hypothetical protein
VLSVPLIQFGSKLDKKVPTRLLERILLGPAVQNAISSARAVMPARLQQLPWQVIYDLLRQYMTFYIYHVNCNKQYTFTSTMASKTFYIYHVISNKQYIFTYTMTSNI